MACLWPFSCFIYSRWSHFAFVQHEFRFGKCLKLIQRWLCDQFHFLEYCSSTKYTSKVSSCCCDRKYGEMEKEQREKQYKWAASMLSWNIFWIFVPSFDFFHSHADSFESQRTMNKQKQKLNECLCVSLCTVALLKQFDNINSNGFWIFKWIIFVPEFYRFASEGNSSHYRKINEINLIHFDIRYPNIFSMELLFTGFERSIPFKCNEIDVIPWDNANQLNWLRSVRLSACNLASAILYALNIKCMVPRQNLHKN